MQLPETEQLLEIHLDTYTSLKQELSHFWIEVDSFLEVLEFHIHHRFQAKAYPAINQCMVCYALKAPSPNAVAAACFQAC